MTDEGFAICVNCFTENMNEAKSCGKCGAAGKAVARLPSGRRRVTFIDGRGQVVGERIFP